MILTDAGPLVALLDADDAHHEECVAAFRTFREPLLTVWPAFTEAMYLVGSWAPMQDALWELLESGALRLARLDEEDCIRARQLMRKYRDVPMDLADAVLVRIAERDGFRRVFTVDRRGFRVYRIGRSGRFEVIP